MEVPFLDLKAQYQAHREEFDTAIQQVIDKTAYAGGPFVQQFEEAFAEYCQTKHAVGVSSGTSALWIALLALGVGPGDEVITTPNTFIATAEAISFTGAKPVFVEISEQTYNMNPAAIEAAITPKTKAIIPVHLFGQMADMSPIMTIAKKHNLFVIEDASQAHGAYYNGRRAGSIADVSCFSFYPGKNLGAFGEAGGIVTNNSELAARMRMIRDHGQSKKYHHRIVGWNGRMDGIQGAVLSVKLKYIDKWNELRRQHAHQYDNLLMSQDNVITPFVASYGIPVYHIYAIRVANRDAVLAAMVKKGVRCGIHYPVPLHLQEAYENLGYKKGSFPISERCSEEYLSLPMFPELTPSQLLHVATTLKEVLNEMHAAQQGDGASEAAGAYKINPIVS